MRLENDTGRILTIVLIAVALMAAIFIFFSIPASNVNDKVTTERLLNCTCKCKD